MYTSEEYLNASRAELEAGSGSGSGSKDRDLNWSTDEREEEIIIYSSELQELQFFLFFFPRLTVKKSLEVTRLLYKSMEMRREGETSARLKRASTNQNALMLTSKWLNKVI